MGSTPTPRKVAVYGRATTIDSRRTTIKASERDTYARNVDRIRKAASKGR